MKKLPTAHCQLPAGFSETRKAANETLPTSGNEVTIGAANEVALSGEEWELVAPWGDFNHPLGVQRFQREQGEALVAAFNSLLGQLGRAFRGVPIFAGHPDVHPDKYQDKRRYGKVEALEVRDDGLYCKPAWNDLGEKNKAEGYYLYPSPVWAFQKVGSNIIEPTKLLSIGLTNMPNIPTSKPWSENEKRPEPPKPNLDALMRYRKTKNQPQGNS